ncbi:TetR/AcrR family transcriptional regulator [Nocardioides albidus]|uniref:TetR/AcrR family transcriptional regulator n=1 Tax=Nocardioides albidus TaxID=1517589 RepID=A0A5C4VYY2_9ACTN|nr:TetR/AcrR family transcriptional regulator [Nocardioides albidus]TNM41194.1 TetR/AcrR family transcriptional regulator [Nocardioides albidus]
MARPSVEAERREQILSATRSVVAEKGFKAMRVADVAARSGISSGTIHYYFDTKRDLMHAAFEWNFENSEARRAALLEDIDDPSERLRMLLASYLPADDLLIESWHLWCSLWVEAIHEPDLQELNEKVYGEWRRGMAAIIRDGQLRGRFVDGDPVLLTNALISMVDGLAIQVLMSSRSMTLDRMRATCDGVVDLLTLPAAAG